MLVIVLGAFLFLLIKKKKYHQKHKTENTYKTGAIVIPILQIRKLRKIKQHAQIHIIG